MGRKIPSKKHRGVKDPLEQQARRLQSIKGKINAPPKDPDEQPVPRSLTRLFAFQDKDKNKLKKKTKQSPVHKDVPTGVGPNPIARLKKLPGESGREFSLRINSAIKALHNPLMQDYPQDVEAEDVKGSQMAEQRARRQRKRQRAARAGGGDEGDAPGRLTRGQKLTLKKNAKKMKAAEESRGDVQYERVAFGEVAHAPPALPAPRRAPAAAAHAPRPGRRELLLSALLPAQRSPASPARPAPPVPPAELERRERARLAAVAAYRLLKKQRLAERTAGAKKKQNRA